MRCPSCGQSDLVNQTAVGVAVDRCGACHGMWLDGMELERLLSRDPPELLRDDAAFNAVPNAPGKPLLCPRCKAVPMIKVNSLLRPGTIIDSCQMCFGIWLDAGELTKLANPDFLTRIRSLFRLRA